MDIAVAAAKRTPIGAFQGALSEARAPELGAAAIRGVTSESGLDPERVDLVLMGNVLPAGMGQAPARQAALFAGLSRSVPTVTVNKMCGSGLEAIVQAVRAIAVGDAKVVVAGGMESMTNAPYLVPGVRGGLRLGDASLVDSVVHDGLWDVYNDMHMGSCAEICAERYSLSREQQDEFAICSYERAQVAMRTGRFREEIVAVEVPGRRGAVEVVSEDEGPLQVDFAKLPTLRPAFERGGTVTAANASTINDGAAALVIAEASVARELGLPVLAQLRGYSVHAQDPEWFTTAPVGALHKLFDRLGWSPDDVDLYEINEAFSVVPMATMREFDLPHDRVNVHGGAVSLGHPVGASGARIVVTLIHALQSRQKSRGVATICIGGGEALALGLELG
ncbi:MAG: thiolase family protein [Truepera sp.]|nr:thiolase family protein [Truepera sp.]